MSLSNPPIPTPSDWTQQAQARLQSLGLRLSAPHLQSLGKGLARLHITVQHQPTDADDFQQMLQQVRHD